MTCFSRLQLSHSSLSAESMSHKELNMSNDSQENEF